VVFPGDTDGSDTKVWMDWSTWSETDAFIEKYMVFFPGFPSPPAGDYTPMAKGMEKANAQIAASTAPYKLVIMLSDGMPYPESYSQQEEIESVHIPFAREHHIIYSPVLLGAGEDAASGLLNWIALKTDYITNPQTSPPYFSFNATNVDEIQAKYDAAITGVSTRIVPKKVTLIEKVNEILEVVDAKLIIQESEFSQNQIDPSTPLDNAVNQFKATGRFHIIFTELVGEVTLKFSVKLKLSEVPLADLSGDYIEVPVNNTAESSITLDHPMYGTLCTSYWPQTKLRFLTGVHVSKELIDPPVGGDYSVKITMANMRATPLEWFWIKETPSIHFDISEITDDFGFSPFSLIVNHFMRPRTVSCLHRIYENTLSPTQMDQLDNNVIEYFQNFVLPYAGQFDPYLCRYDVTFNLPQRGIFKLVWNVPPLEERTLCFKVKGASIGARTSGTPHLRSNPVDDHYLKPPLASRYRYPGVVEWKYLESNPELEHIVVHGPKPELGIITCFDVIFLEHFFEDLVGIEPLAWPNDAPPNRAKVLDSSDITPKGLRGSPDPLGLSIVVRNSGNQSGFASLTARSIFIPFPDANNPPNEWVKPFECRYDDPQINVDARARATLPATYDSVILGNGISVPVADHPTMFSTFSGWVISTVDIGPATGELFLGNNNAIEIKFFDPPMPPINPSYWEGFWGGFRRTSKTT